jgi:hypothetical protein
MRGLLDLPQRQAKRRLGQASNPLRMLRFSCDSPVEAVNESTWQPSILQTLAVLYEVGLTGLRLSN